MKALLGWLGLLAAFVFLRPSCDIEVRFSIPSQTETPDGAIDQWEEEDNGWIEAEDEPLGGPFSIAADSALADSARAGDKASTEQRRKTMSLAAPSPKQIVDDKWGTVRKKPKGAARASKMHVAQLGWRFTSPQLLCHHATFGVEAE